MGRPQCISDEEILSLMEQYQLDNPGVAVDIPKFGVYVRSKGYDVKDYTIRRNKAFRAKLEAVNNDSIVKSNSDVINYYTIDADAFITKNKTKASLKAALIVRDQYYADIADKAVKAIAKRKKVENELAAVKLKIKGLEDQLVTVQAKADTLELRKKDKAISVLKRILNSVVYPAIADMMLEKEGVLDIVASALAKDLVDIAIVDGNTNIKEAVTDIESNQSTVTSKFDSVNSLLGGFDE